MISSSGRLMVKLQYRHTTEHKARQWCAELTVALNRRVCGLDVVRRCVDSLSYGCQPKKFLPYSVLESDYTHDTNIIRFRVTEIKVFN